MRANTLLLLAVVFLAGCGSEDKRALTTETVVSRIPVSESRIPDDVKARLEKDGLNVGALQALIDRLKDEDKATLLKIIVTDQSWGLSAVKGSPDSYLVDELYAKVPGYTKIND